MSLKKTKAKLDKVRDLHQLRADVQETMGKEVDTGFLIRHATNKRLEIANSIGKKKK